MDTTVGRADPRSSAVAARPLWSGLVPFGVKRLTVAVSPFIVTCSDHPAPIGREGRHQF